MPHFGQAVSHLRLRRGRCRILSYVGLVLALWSSPTLACVPLEEPLSVRPGVCFSMIRRGDRYEHRSEMGPKLGMAAVRIEHVPQPRVLEEHHSYALGRRRLSEDGSSACLWAVGQGRWLSRSFAWAGARSQAIRLIGPAIVRRKLGRRSCSRCPRTRASTAAATRSPRSRQNACSRWHTGGLVDPLDGSVLELVELLAGHSCAGAHCVPVCRLAAAAHMVAAGRGKKKLADSRHLA
jgi:hypothetical protein